MIAILFQYNTNQGRRGGKMAKDNKTNVCRLLDKAKISYVEQEYPVDEEDLSGAHVASVLGFPPEIIYKTLVLKGDKTGYFVAVIPVLEEVDLKKAAKVSKNKKVEMIPMKDLQPLTGYIRGGCSPIGMKKHFPTYFQKQGEELERIYVSAGKRGLQIGLSPKDLCTFVSGSFEDLIRGGEE